MKTLKYPFPIDLAVIMSILCSEHSTQPETIFLSEAFLVIVIHQYFLFVYMQLKTYIAFTCVNPLLFLLLFIIFIVLLPFSMNFKSNFGFNFSTVKGRIQCEIFLSEHFMKYSFRVISWNMNYFHEILLF